MTAGTLEVYEAGELTVVGFGGRDVLDHIHVGEYRDEIVELIREHHCRALAFDLTGVQLLPSGLLGLFATVSRLGVEVHLYNASEDIREVLAITKLNQLLHLHDVEIA